jgi:hypothetical protein
MLIGFFAICVLPVCCLNADTGQQFCNNVIKSDFEKVGKDIEKYIVSNKNLIRSSNTKFKPVVEWLKQYDCITDVIPPESIAEIFPARYAVFVNFKTAKGNRMMNLNLQEGKTKSGADLTKRDENNDMFFLSLTDSPDGARQFVSFSKAMIENTLKPGENKTMYPASSFFNNQQYLDFYKEEIEDMDTRKIFMQLDNTHNNKQWFAAIKQLKEKHAVYHLSASLAHSSYDVRIAAVVAIKELNNPVTVPFLIKVAKENAMDVQGSEESTLHKIYQKNMIEALNTLTHKKVVYKAGDETNTLKKGITIWDKAE